MRPRWPGGGWAVAGTAWLGVIGWSTLRSAPAQATAVAALRWYCIACGHSGATDVVLNLLLFMPLGLAARALNWPLRRTIVLLFGLSLAIEVTQGTLLVGRDASLGDVLMNTAGGAVGWLALFPLRRMARPSLRGARIGAGATLALGIAIWLTTAIALQPLLTDAEPWIGQRTPVLPFHDPFAGRLLGASLNGKEISEGPMAPVSADRDSLDLSIDVSGAGVVPERPATLVRILDADQQPQVEVTQQGNDVLVEFALRGSAWRLRTPEWRFRDAFHAPANGAERLRWQWRGDRIEFTRSAASDSSPDARITVPVSIALGWIFLHPFVGTVGPSELLWTTLWLGWWFGLLGWFAGWCRGSDQWRFGVAGVAAFVVAGITMQMRVSPPQLVAALASYLALLAAANARRIRRDAGFPG